MRLWNTIILLIVICLCVQGCAGAITPDDTTNEGVALNHSGTSSESTHLENLEDEEISEEISPIPGEIPLLTLETYDDYLAYIDSKELPDNFVDYESVAHFGSFRSFVCLTDSRCGDYSQYMYNLVGPNNAKLSITIIDTDKHETTLYSASGTMDVNRIDMRQTTNSQSGSHTENGICYTYVSGKLLCIAWQSGNLTFVVSGNSMLGDYPNVTTTPIAELLNISDKTQLEIQAILSNSDAVTE